MNERRIIDVDGRPVLLINSITEVQAEDAGRIVVSGSHGGVSAANHARQVSARLYVFNDAGVGKQQAGVAGLSLLEEAGIAACAVAHDSARIGDAADTLVNGVISHANETAEQLGFVAGRALKMALAAGTAI